MAPRGRSFLSGRALDRPGSPAGRIGHGRQIRRRGDSGETRAGEAEADVVVAVAGRVVVAIRRSHVTRVVVPAAAAFDAVLPPPAEPTSTVAWSVNPVDTLLALRYLPAPLNRFGQPQVGSLLVYFVLAVARTENDTISLCDLRALPTFALKHSAPSLPFRLRPGLAPLP